MNEPIIDVCNHETFQVELSNAGIILGHQLYWLLSELPKGIWLHSTVYDAQGATTIRPLTKHTFYFRAEGPGKKNIKFDHVFQNNDGSLCIVNSQSITVNVAERDAADDIEFIFKPYENGKAVEVRLKGR